MKIIVWMMKVITFASVLMILIGFCSMDSEGTLIPWILIGAGSVMTVASYFLFWSRWNV